MQLNVAKSIAYALNNSGTEVITHVPGYGGNEVFKEFREVALKNPFISFNEETAYGIAHGAAMAGKRSSIIIKTHGYLKAGNAVIDSLYTSITAGLLLLIFDDKSGKHSDCIFDIFPHLEAAGLPYKVGSPQHIYEQITEAYTESETKRLPVAIIIDSEDVKKLTVADTETQNKKNFVFKKDVLTQIVNPMLTDFQYRLFSAKRLTGELSGIISPAIPVIPEDVSNSLREQVILYKDFFDVFKRIKHSIVTGDTSLATMYAFAPYYCIDFATYMGGSIPLAIGAYLAGNQNVWAMTGDFAFISAGFMGLLEAFQRQIPLKIVIFNNKKAAATGGQPIDKKIILRILMNYENYITHISDPHNPFEISKVLNEINESKELSIIIVDY